MKDHTPLCAAIVDAMLLLESASPNEINPDVAVRGMESISSSLLMLDEDDQLSLRLDFQHFHQKKVSSCSPNSICLIKKNT